METKIVLYVGPNGVNPELGHCVNGEEKEIPIGLYEKYKLLGYIEDVTPVKTKRSLKREV